MMRIIQEIQKLSLEDKIELRDNLDALIRKDKDDAIIAKKSMMHDVVSGVCKRMGLDYGTTCRNHDNVVMRIIASNILIKQGCNLSEIGRVMRKNRRTIDFYSNTLKLWQDYPNFYGDELKLWKEISKDYGIE